MLKRYVTPLNITEVSLLVLSVVYGASSIHNFSNRIFLDGIGDLCKTVASSSACYLTHDFKKLMRRFQEDSRLIQKYIINQQ